jgi:hypothetical protein
MIYINTNVCGTHVLNFGLAGADIGNAWRGGNILWVGGVCVPGVNGGLPSARGSEIDRRRCGLGQAMSWPYDVRRRAIFRGVKECVKLVLSFNFPR